MSGCSTQVWLYIYLSLKIIWLIWTILTRLDLISWFYFSSAAVVPVAGVGSRLLKLLIPDLQMVLFCRSMPPRLQALMSALTQSDHVFLGLPHAFEHEPPYWWKTWYRMNIFLPLYLTFDLKGWPLPWQITLQNVRLEQMHMRAKYQVSICNGSKVMANVKVVLKQTNKQTGQKQYAPQIRSGGHNKK